MRWPYVNILVLASLMALPGVDAVYADELHQCFFESIQATFTADKSTYRVEAGCKEYDQYDWIKNPSTPMHWSSHGSYDPHSGLATEVISMRVDMFGGDTATVTTTLSCPSDPWLGPSLEPGMVACKNPTFTTGELKGPSSSYLFDRWFLFLQEGFYSIIYFKKIGPLPNSTGFQYNRAELIAQRNAALKAEADAVAAAAAAAEAARLKEGRRLQQSTKPAPTLLENLAPFVTSPVANSLYLSMTTVPIKLAPPPRRMTVTLYMVKIERRDARGIWTPVVNLPIGLAEASSPSGYLGWGTGGSGGRSPNFMALPGTYRVSAQVSGPRPTAWSQPIEFVVTAPNKAIQKGPQMFGQ